MVKVGQGTSVAGGQRRDRHHLRPELRVVGFNGDTVSVINGATCNGTNHSGCGHLAATVKVGFGPFGVAVNDRTHTVYVANNADGDSPGTVSVINGATCNGTNTTGCHRRFPTMATGTVTAARRGGHPHRHRLRHRLLERRGVDPGRITLQRLGDQRMRAQATREQAVGSRPFGLAINPHTRTVYVANTFQAGSMSIFSTTRH